jgi:3-hydroxyacyl-CoA dehydrogenase
VQARRDLASCTSYLDVDEIAASTSVRRHFFSPANVVMLLEVVRGANTDDDVLATVMALAKTIKNVAVVTAVTFGFIGNRMLRQRQTEAAELLLAGASPEQIDKVHTDFWHANGLFQITDVAGVDTGWHRDPNRIENIREALAAGGRWARD